MCGPLGVQSIPLSLKEGILNYEYLIALLCLCRGNGDRLILRGMRFHGKHGVLPEERTLGQKFDVDVDAWMDLSKAGETDQLDDSVSYTDIYRSGAP